MRVIEVDEIKKAVAEMCLEANYRLGDDVTAALKEARRLETSPTGKNVLAQIMENAALAAAEEVPMCQDTGFAVVFIELGQEVRLAGGGLKEAVNRGVRLGYEAGFLRKSIVADPFNRVNTGDNTPAVIHIDLVPGDKVKLIFAPKGGGSENMSAVKMLSPAEGRQGVMDFIINHVKEAGASPCPPVIVGVGVGGTFEQVALLAKKALLRRLGQKNPAPFYAEMEAELLKSINNLGIGPQGFGGRITALAVHIEAFPCHIASLPAAVSLNCHAARHAERII